MLLLPHTLLETRDLRSGELNQGSKGSFDILSWDLGNVSSFLLSDVFFLKVWSRAF